MKTMRQGNGNPKIVDREKKRKLLTELKCYLQKPMESNLDILFSEMQDLVHGPQEKKYYESAPSVEKALSLEDMFNGFT